MAFAGCVLLMTGSICGAFNIKLRSLYLLRVEASVDCEEVFRRLLKNRLNSIKFSWIALQAFRLLLHWSQWNIKYMGSSRKCSKLLEFSLMWGSVHTFANGLIPSKFVGLVNLASFSVSLQYTYINMLIVLGIWDCSSLSMVHWVLY
jgi:hypothetical protein